MFSFEPEVTMKTAVLLVLVSLVVDPSYALLISEDPDQTQPSEDENRLKRNIFLPIGSYIVSQDLDDKSYEGIEGRSENDGDDEEIVDSEERAFEKSVNDFKMDRRHDKMGKKVFDPFRPPRRRPQGGRRRRRSRRRL